MPMATYYLQTFGCQMNKSDSERIAFVLEETGFKKTARLDEASLVVINICSVRQSAIDRIYGLILNIKNKKSKTQIKNQKIILTGCIPAKDKEKLKNKVDLIFKIQELSQLPQKLAKKGLLRKKIALAENYLEIPSLYSSWPSAYVPIMTGCDNFCAYCVVPYLRGREYSRSPLLILKEIKNLLKKGFKRIILLGQNVNSYKAKGINFPQLLKLAADLPGKFWLSFMTSHPKDLSDELIETVFSSDKICKYFHLPIQSGSDKILKKMNRGYTVKQYEKIIQKIRKAAKNKKTKVAISTDIIVGFPGETIKDFNKTVSLLKKINYDMAYISKYSPRPLTAASKLKDDVSSLEKKRRQKKLFKILKRTALNNNKKYLHPVKSSEGGISSKTKLFNRVNKEVDVLIMGQDKKGCLWGETSTFKKVNPSSRTCGSLRGRKIIGKFHRIKITKVSPWGLAGLIVHQSQ